MPRLVISTVGTSVLNNQLNGEFEADWSSRLQETANYTDKEVEYYEDVSAIIKTLTDRAKQKLYSDPERKIINDNIAEIRGASAELNGIYGLYQEQLNRGNQDHHWLIATDTAQGQVAAEIVKEFLQSRVNLADIHTPKELSTASTESFTNGIDELLGWIEETVPSYQKHGYQVCFNLVGGFKALQGYANTIGMFYADEIIYIFEGGSDEVITIPRLPIKIDRSVIKPVQFALMAANAWVKLSDLQDVPETLRFVVDDEATLSNWGRLTWNRCKEDILSGDLLDFPKLKYEDAFKRDYESQKGQNERLKLQETLAKVSKLLIKSNGDTGVLKKDGGLLYEVYEKKGGIAHFRVTQGLRVSCITSDGVLHLRRYGSEPDVNRNP